MPNETRPGDERLRIHVLEQALYRAASQLSALAPFVKSEPAHPNQESGEQTALRWSKEAMAAHDRRYGESNL